MGSLKEVKKKDVQQEIIQIQVLKKQCEDSILPQSSFHIVMQMKIVKVLVWRNWFPCQINGNT